MQKRHNIVRLMYYMVFILFMSSFAYSNVEVFSNYDTVLTINNDDTISINKSLTLKNVYDVGIVPGQIEFKIAKGVDGSVGNIKVLNVSAIDKFGKEIKTHQRTTKDFSVVVMDVYYPLLPGFEYEFDLDYTISYDPGGIFFKSLQIPLRESTIPIEKGEFKVVLPDNSHFTYLGTENATLTEGGNIAVWNIKNNIPNSVVFEYSWIPIRIGDFKGSYIFWILVNVVLLLLLFFEVRREIKKVRAKYEG